MTLTYYLRARYYKPDAGRFWTMDTYGGNNEDPLSLHKYLYCSENPLNITDRSGHEGEVGSQLGVVGGMGYLAANIYVRAFPILFRATVLVFEASTEGTVIIGGGTIVAGGAALSKVEGGLGTWTTAVSKLQGVLFGPYSYLKAVLQGSGRQANHLNQAGAFTQITKEVGACVNLDGNAIISGTEHNQFHVVLEQFWDQFRKNKGGIKAGQMVSNKDYLEALRGALTVVKDGTTGVQKYTKDQIDALVDLAEKEQRGYGYFDEIGGLRPEVPGSMNVTE